MVRKINHSNEKLKLSLPNLMLYNHKLVKTIKDNNLKTRDTYW